MHIFTLRYPGTNLDGVADVRTVMTQLATLECSLADAAVALDLFEKSRAIPVLPGSDQANASDMPYGYTRRLPFIFAHTVVYALDAISKTIGVLAKTSGLPNSDIQKAYDDFKAALPNLLLVRNSAHHVEDRARGLGKGQVPLQTPFLSISNLIDNRLNYTVEDGSQGEVEITKNSVEVAQQAIQQTFNALSWSGPSWDAPMSFPGSK
jgi:hypothetical protein